MQEISATPWDLLALLLTTVLRLLGLPDLHAPAAWCFEMPKAQAQAAETVQLVGMHTVAVMVDRADPKSIAEQCDVELALPDALPEHRVLCDLPLAGLHHHRLRVVEPGSGHLFLPGRCPKELRLPDVVFPRLAIVDADVVRTQRDVLRLCGPAAGRLHR